MGVQSGLANTLNNLGQACYGLGEFEAAGRYLEEALRITQEISARRAGGAGARARASRHPAIDDGERRRRLRRPGPGTPARAAHGD